VVALPASLIANIVMRTLASTKAVIGWRLDKQKHDRVDVLTTALKPEADAFLLSALADLNHRLPHLAQVAVGEFLRSPDGDAFVRCVAVAVLSGEDQTTLETLKLELQALLALFAGLEKEQQRIAAESLLNIFTNSFRKTAASIRRLDTRYHVELVNRAYQERSAGLLKGAAQRTPLLATVTGIDFTSIDTFIARYKGALHEASSYLVPAYFDKQRRVPIESLYVVPRFQLLAENSPYDKSVQQDAITLNEFLAFLHRAAVLGAPGAGKSTLTQRIAYDFSEHTNSYGLIPFIVPVRKYEGRQSKAGHSVVEFLSSYINERYQVPASQNVVQLLLLTGRAIVIFDGIDELLDISHRREVVSKIESFATLYSTCPIIATSRAVEYYSAPLNPPIFKAHLLREFIDEDVREYAQNWFNVDERLDPSERMSVATAFLNESASVKDLRSNPLLLGLLCNVYRGPRSIPQTRAELYERCAVMLFEEWDASRGIKTKGPLKADVKGALRDIALWVYTNPELANGVRESALRKRLRAYWKKRFDNDDVANQEAKELISLWKGRSWVLTDVGPTDDRRELKYNFTHRTFLEYFAAIELERKHPSPKRLWAALQDWLRVGQGEIVAQVAIQTLDQAYEDAGNSIAKLLINSFRQIPSPLERLNLLSFCARNLDSLSLSADVLRTITDAAVMFCIDGVLATSPSCEEADHMVYPPLGEFPVAEDEDIAGDEFMEPLMRLVCYTSPFSTIVGDRLTRRCVELIEDEDPRISGAAYLMFECESEFRQAAAIRHANEVADKVDVLRPRQVIARLDASAYLPAVAERASAVNFWVPVIAARRGHLVLEEAIRLGATDLIVCSESPFNFYEPKIGAEMPILEAIIRQYLKLDCSQVPLHFLVDDQRMTDVLHAIAAKVRERAGWVNGDWLRRTNVGAEVISATYVGSQREEADFWDLGPDEIISEDQEMLAFEDPDCAFAAAFQICVLAEQESWQLIDLSSDQAADLKLGPIQGLEAIFHSRFITGFELDAKAALQRSNLRAEDADLLQRWALRQWNLIQTKDWVARHIKIMFEPTSDEA
jgi:NACHT domain-containing protein